MFKKLFTILFLTLLLNHCGYSPIYTIGDNTNIYIEEINFAGDQEINNLILKKLKKYMRIENNRKFIVKVNSKYSKISQTKNTYGATTSFKLTLKINFEVQQDKIKKDYSFSEEFTLKDFTNEFEENKYEKTIQDNLASLIINNLLLRLSKL